MSADDPQKVPLEALQKIKDEEEKARSLILAARDTEAVEIVQAAQEEARTLVQKLLEEARLNAAEKRQEIVQAAEVEADEIRRSSEEEASALRENAVSLLEGAVAKTAHRIQEYLQERMTE